MKAAILFSLLVGAAVCFDARNQWPGCVQNILDQGQCGSCWAFAAHESFADRMCIAGDTSLTIASPEPCIDCTRNACNGNTADTAWKFLINSGSTTCTNLCTSGCAPVDSYHGKPNACSTGKCDSGSSWPTTYKATGYKMLPKGAISQYESALQGGGPLQAWFQVYDSFYSFFSQHKTGIYTKGDVSGSYEGNHFVKLIGWGSSNGVDYWIAANSWGKSWGDNGYFKIQKGINLCGFEQYVYEGFAKGQSAAPATYSAVANKTFLEPEAVAGHWVEQEDHASEMLDKAVEAALRLISSKTIAPPVFQRLRSAHTQVVSGLNIKLHMELVGSTVDVTIFRDLDFEFHLKEVNFHF